MTAKKKKRRTRKWRGASYHESVWSADRQIKQIKRDGYEARKRRITFTLPNKLTQRYILVEWRPKAKKRKRK